jgi:hypothetical protein
MANLVQQLINLGVDPAVAFSTEYYKQRTRDNVQELAAEGGFVDREKLNPAPQSAKDQNLSTP